MGTKCSSKMAISEILFLLGDFFSIFKNRVSVGGYNIQFVQYAIKPITPMKCHHYDRNTCVCVCVYVCVPKNWYPEVSKT